VTVSPTSPSGECSRSALIRALESWADGQRAKALHVGTDEAAIVNVLGRMRDQDGAGEQLYLYSVPSIDTFRFINTHEDPSSVSLAITMDAIEAVQGLPVPRTVDVADPWAKEATTRLLDAATMPAPQPKTALERMRRHVPSALSLEAHKLEKELADVLPLVRRARFHAGFDEASLASERSRTPGNRWDQAPSALRKFSWNLEMSSDSTIRMTPGVFASSAARL
jgi:hypothetical protein